MTRRVIKAPPRPPASEAPRRQTPLQLLLISILILIPFLFALVAVPNPTTV